MVDEDKYLILFVCIVSVVIYFSQLFNSYIEYLEINNLNFSLTKLPLAYLKGLFFIIYISFCTN